MSPLDGVTPVPLAKKSQSRYVSSVLPMSSSGSLTCYVEVIQSTGASMIFYSSVTVSSPTVTVSSLNSMVSGGLILDNLVAVNQVANTL